MNHILKFFAALALSASLLQADFKTDLANINTSMVELNSSISNAELNSTTLCASLISLNQQAKEIVNAIVLLNDSFSSPITLDNETLLLTENLFVSVASLSNQSSLLSDEITLIQPDTNAFILADAISAMLQLSSDIGEMADRIGEMADNILIMSDNIGLMADRILEMQVIQSENLILTQNTILQTQTNTLALVSVIETASYDLSLNTLITQGNILVAQMASVSLNPWNMASELDNVQTDVHNYLVQVEQFKDLLNTDMVQNTIYINSDALNKLVDLSIIMNSIGIVMDGYGTAIEASQSFTRTSTLLDAMDSMLSLSSDIGKLANNILEMADQILLMADNIGVSADQILLTQELQNTNIAATQASVLTAQQLAIGIIAANN
ncbi:hypothetical protein TSL6_00300 [Sulfurovum sp. TSL6]|uniref:hypothetical protein n=1 Tax=Sulfurovum sp. TSL6 TaxID=2826995 RepID=UPI001CC36BBA|nr:hypothetical protein [Sulfurovum sp. TSL6]GIT99523.1 hypothetical protein TSL6_00300 [Sulfurovum sp. TSL6]